MTQQEKNQKLAEWDGWTRVENYLGVDYEIPPNLVNPAFKQKLPNYFTSLDAVHELEEKAFFSKGVPASRWEAYDNRLHQIVGGFGRAHATADQRAEALGLTLGLWKEGE